MDRFVIEEFPVEYSGPYYLLKMGFLCMITLEDMQTEVMVWPPHSPDLNPIENLRPLLKAEIYRLRPDLIHMKNNDETKKILVETAQISWRQDPPPPPACVSRLG